MLFRTETLEGIAAGRVTMAFRRWRRPTVKVGGTLRTPIGVLAIDDVAVVEAADVTDMGMEKLDMKRRIRALKELGLTESLEVGYRLSPRGKAVLDALTGDGEEQSA